MRRIAWVLLLVFTFTIPWAYSLDLGPPFGNIARIAGVILLLVFVPAVLQAGRIRALGPVQWLTIALYLWFCCSYFWTIDAMATMERLRAYAQVMMIVGLTWELAESPGDLRDLMQAYVGGSWVLAGLTLAAFVSPANAGQVRFAAEGQDPNDVARFLDVALPMAALILHVDRRWWCKTLAIGYLSLGVLAVLLTASRGGLLAASIAIAGSALLLLRFHPRMRLGVLTVVLALAALIRLAIPSATIARLATIPEQLTSGDLNQRLNIWGAGWQAFARAPFMGSGAGSFVAAAGLARIDTAHNTALSIAVEGGLVALAVALAIAVAAVRSLLRKEGAVRIALGTAMLVWLLTSLVATVEGNRSTWFLLALVSTAGRLAWGAPTAESLRFERHASSDSHAPIQEPAR